MSSYNRTVYHPFYDNENRLGLGFARDADEDTIRKRLVKDISNRLSEIDCSPYISIDLAIHYLQEYRREIAIELSERYLSDTYGIHVIGIIFKDYTNEDCTVYNTRKNVQFRCGNCTYCIGDIIATAKSKHSNCSIGTLEYIVESRPDFSSIIMQGTCTAYGATYSKEDSQDPLLLQDVLREYLRQYTDVRQSHWSRSIGMMYETRIQVYFRYSCLLSIKDTDIKRVKDCYLIDKSEDGGTAIYKWSEGSLYIPKNIYLQYRDLNDSDKRERIEWTLADWSVSLTDVQIIKWID